MSVDSGGVLQAKSNRGPKQKEGNPNIFCRLCKKNLRIDSVQAISASDAMLSKLNVDDLDTSSGSKIKVVIAFPSGHVRAQSTFDGEVQSVIMYLALGRWGPYDTSDV